MGCATHIPFVLNTVDTGNVATQEFHQTWWHPAARRDNFNTRIGFAFWNLCAGLVLRPWNSCMSLLAPRAATRRNPIPLRAIWILLGCLGLLTATRSVAAQQDLDAKEEAAFRQAAALVAPSIIKIETVGGLDRVQQVLLGTGPTTGVAVAADGYIISSAFNFISRPATILATLPDGRRLPAKQVATDHLRMLTLLKIEADNLVPAQAAPTGDLRVGQWAIAMGKSLDETPSVSLGIVSALGRVWGKAIQTDAKVSPVNYGGPLVGVEGKVMGILVPLSPMATGDVAGVEWYDSGIGFAIPLADVYASLDRLKTGKDLFPGLMGVTLKGQDLYEKQAQIDRVRYGSPAYEAGVKDGDTIVELDGKPIRAQAQMKHVLGNKYAGDKVQLTVSRGTDRITRELTLTDKLVPYESAFLGVLPVRTGANQPAKPGVVVRYVYADSPAARVGIERGQEIVRVGADPVTNSDMLSDKISRMQPGEKVKLAVATAGQEREVEVVLGSMPTTVPVDIRPSPQPPREKDLADATLKLGRFSEKSEAHDHEYWAFVPEDYNPDFEYSLLVWLHPPGDSMEAAMLKAWQTHCEEWGIILLAPKAKNLAGWTPDETEFVKDLTEQFQQKYKIDRTRTALHTHAATGMFAFGLTFKHRTLFRGMIGSACSLPGPPPDNEPESRQQFHLTSVDTDPLHRLVLMTAKALRDQTFPVVHTILHAGGGKYPGGSTLLEMAIWLDSLDRI